MDLTLGNKLASLHGPILVTGHTGFKGTWLTFLLENLDISVVGLSLPPEENSLFKRANRFGKIPEEFIDIRNATLVTKFMNRYQPSAIIHMAAQPLVIESYKTPRATFETNVMGTVNVLDAAFQAKSVEAVVVVTTDKVYRNYEIGREFVETDPLEGKDPYSASKVGTEAVVAAWQQISKVDSGPQVISVRAGNVIGGGDWAENRLLPDLIRGFLTNDPIQIRNPHSTRPWQHVLDPLHGYILALEASMRGSNFASMNFGPESPSLSVREVVSIASQMWRAKNPIEYLENTPRAFPEAVSLSLDSHQAQSTLGWTPRWTQEEAVQSTMQWWKQVTENPNKLKEACLRDIEKITQEE